jgi:hypothetical protein
MNVSLSANITANQRAIFNAIDRIQTITGNALGTLAMLAQDRAKDRGFVQGDPDRVYQDLPQNVKAIEQTRRRVGPSERYKRGFSRQNRYAPRPTRAPAQPRRAFAKGKIVGRQLDYIDTFRTWDLDSIMSGVHPTRNFTKTMRRDNLEFTMRRTRGHLTATYEIKGDEGKSLFALANIRKPGRQRLRPLHQAFSWSARQITRHMEYQRNRTP